MRGQRLGLVALFALVGLGVAPVNAADVNLFWNCAPQTPGSPAGWCPVGTAYPLPTVGGGTPTNPSSVVGFDSGTNPALGAGASQTPTNISHTAGQSVGGLFTIPVARINGGSGAVSRFFGHSNGGDVGQLQWKIWDKNPASTTCTDNVAFVGNATDDLHLIATPFTLTPLLNSQTQGDAKTYWEQDFIPPASYLNQDTLPSLNIYVCAVAVTTFTPTAQPYVVDATGYQN
jgi:hypothetical protein